MAESPEGEEPDLKAVSAEEQAELRRLDALILAGRDRPTRAGSLLELRWLLYLVVVLLIVAVIGYLVLPAPDRRVVALMAAIAGGVLAVWGGVRGVIAAQGGGIAGIAWVYTLFFGAMALIFGVLGAGLIGWLDGK